MAADKNLKSTSDSILTVEQEELLDLYILNLHKFTEDLKASEKIQVEIETEHLKRILTS